MAHKTYSPKDVKISFNGIDIVGFAEDDFLTLSRTSPLIEPTVGADGVLTRTKVADRTGTITLNLAQTAQSNLILSEISRIQQVTPDLPIGNFIISDPSGSVLAVGINATLASLPEVSLGSTATNSKSWEWHCEFLEYTYIPNDLLDSIPTYTFSDGKFIKA